MTRQLVGAVEAGRHVPGVAAALGLARALDATVEDLFGEPSVAVVDVLGAELRPGTPIVTARVGDRIVGVPHSHGVGTTESWGLAEASWGNGSAEWLPGGAPADLAVAGCDPLLGVLTGLTGRTGHQLIHVHASTGQSLDALAARTVHGVLVHARSGDLPTPPVPVRRWHVASWQVGLAGVPGGPGPQVEELASRAAVVVQRDPGAGTQQAFVRALSEVGASAEVAGPVGDGHLDVARRLVHGVAEAGVLMEPAAIAYGLGFTGLETHTIELWLAEEWVGLPAAIALLEVLNSDALLRRVQLLGGYDPSGCGSAVPAV